jgi:hypothetical protein
LCGLLSEEPDGIAQVLQLQAEHLLNPPRSVWDVLETLRKSLPRFVERVQSAHPLVFADRELGAITTD